MDKKHFRSKAKHNRDSILITDKKIYDEDIFKRICNLPTYNKADVVMIYVSYESEVNTLVVIKDALNRGKAVVVPKVINNNIEFFYIKGLDDLEKGYKGILEPITKDMFRYDEYIKEGHSSIIMFVPGLAFDTIGNRIGYGGGYYDRYLYNKDIFTVGLAYDNQIMDNIPYNDKDVRIKIIITQKGIIGV